VAILIPAGFFLAAAGRGAERPNRLVVLVYVGALSLALGAVTLGIGLLRAQSTSSPGHAPLAQQPSATLNRGRRDRD
jgi:hypothetical protein